MLVPVILRVHKFWLYTLCARQNCLLSACLLTLPPCYTSLYMATFPANCLSVFQPCPLAILPWTWKHSHLTACQSLNIAVLLRFSMHRILGVWLSPSQRRQRCFLAACLTSNFAVLILYLSPLLRRQCCYLTPATSLSIYLCSSLSHNVASPRGMMMWWSSKWAIVNYKQRWYENKVNCSYAGTANNQSFFTVT